MCEKTEGRVARSRAGVKDPPARAARDAHGALLLGVDSAPSGPAPLRVLSPDGSWAAAPVSSPGKTTGELQGVWHGSPRARRRQRDGRKPAEGPACAQPSGNPREA